MLRSDLTARENLWAAVCVACVVVCRRYKWYGLNDDSKHELLEAMELAAFRHFLKHKVMGHGYCRTTKDGKPLTFLDNAIGSAWAVSVGVKDQYMRKVVTVRANTLYLDSPRYTPDGEYNLVDTLTSANKRLYLGKAETACNRNEPYSRMTPRQRANAIRADWDDYCLECDELGVTRLTREQWLESTGYGQDEDAMWWVHSPEERRAVQKAKKAKEREAKAVARQAEKLNRQRAKDRQHYLPKGWTFVERDGILCITRVEDEQCV